MFESGKKVELIIVCDKKRMQYAKYLMQLLGKKDDTEDSVVGTVDGSVSAAIYTEKQYADSLAKISSNTHVLFIGKSPTTKQESEYIDYKINKFGMKFGWQGKHAVMFVEKTLKKSELDDFIKFADNYQLEFKKKSTEGWKIAADAAAWVLLPFLAAPATIIKSSDEIQDKQYRCLTIATYIDGLQEFLEA